jgi:DNA repair exonuclease SbcCD ATPase subunit
MASNKLVFKSITAKNFRIIGNTPISLEYCASNTTLIASVDNGSGKSTLSIWALYFVLFGKGYKQGSKIASLVNNKSNKDCLVELTFETAGSVWLIKRGYKPAIFEIYRDDVLVENEAAKSDTQAYLESVIGMDEKAFCNIVALGIARFVPFVAMRAEERRNFVEQMLDMIVISNMNAITKADIKIVRDRLKQLTYDTGILESKYAGSVRTLTILEEKKKQRLSESGSQLDVLEAELAKTDKLIKISSDKIEKLKLELISDTDSKVSEIKAMVNKFKFKLDDIKNNADKVTNLLDCPTCKQSVTSDHKHDIQNSAMLEMEKLIAPLAKLDTELQKAEALVEQNRAIQESINKVQVVKIQLDTKWRENNSFIKEAHRKLVDTNEDALINEENTRINDIKAELELKQKETTDQNEVESHHLQFLQVLKDDGIKASIVAQYLPFLNQTINSILDKLNLYVQVNIDSEFNISLYAPDRKGQTIENLSDGQIRRIDLAVLLAWREIAKKKASVDCNILILDEILENLSASGVDEFMEMWTNLSSDTNLIVISQRAAEFDPYFDRTIKYALKNDMTVEV